MERTIHNGNLVESLRWAVSTARHGVETVPEFLRAVIANRAWEGARHDPQVNESLPGSSSLLEFIQEEPILGLGVSVDFLERFCDEETKDMLRVEIDNPGQISTTEDMPVESQLKTIMTLFSQIDGTNQQKFLAWAEMEALRGVTQRPTAKAVKVSPAAPVAAQARDVAAPRQKRKVNRQGDDVDININGTMTSVRLDARSSITKDNAQDIVNDYLGGATYDDVKKKYGTSVNAISKLCQELGINRPRHRRSARSNVETENEVVEKEFETESDGQASFSLTAQQDDDVHVRHAR